MSSRKPRLGFLLTGVAALLATNKYIANKSMMRHTLPKANQMTFDFKYGDVIYYKIGEGAPILLLHDLDNIASSYEWKRVRKTLSEKYTVYTLDLLGCGLSDKPNLTYTNYMYVELVRDFIKNVIGEKVDIIASHDASSIALMSKTMVPDFIRRIIMINPTNLNEMNMETNQLDMLHKTLLYTPLLGQALYNYHMREDAIKENLATNFFLNQSNSSKWIDGYYEAAHASDSRGRYLYASKKCKYLSCNMAHALKDKKSIYILTSKERPNQERIVNAYLKINDTIKVTELEGSRLLPQIESPEEFIKAIRRICR